MNFYWVILKVLIVAVAFFPRELEAVTYSPDREVVVCFVVKKSGRSYFYSEGEVYQAGGTLLGRTKTGCIVLPKDSSKKVTLRFYPDETKKHGQFFQYQGVTLNGNKNFHLTAKQHRDFNKLVSGGDLNSFRICFIKSRTANSFVYYDSGKVYSDDDLIGEVKEGCLDVSKNICRNRTTLKFYPDKLTRFNTSFTYRNANTCRDGDYKIGSKNYANYVKFATAVPYVENVDIKNEYFKNLARELTKDCPDQDRNCLIFKAYRYVVKNLRYIHDRVGIGQEDQIISPLNTIKRGGGDCEDLTGVLNSILSALNVPNYVVLTHRHAYSLACGIDAEKMNALIINGLVKESVTEKKVTLKGQSVVWYSTSFNNRLDKSTVLNLTSDSPIDFYFVPNTRDYRNLYNNRPIALVNDCFAKNTKSIAGKRCATTNKDIHLMFYNPLKKPAKVNFRAVTKYYAFSGDRPKLSLITHKNEKCILLEATLDDSGYPGFANQRGRENLAINPKSWEWFIF